MAYRFGSRYSHFGTGMNNSNPIRGVNDLVPDSSVNVANARLGPNRTQVLRRPIIAGYQTNTTIVSREDNLRTGVSPYLYNNPASGRNRKTEMTDQIRFSPYKRPKTEGSEVSCEDRQILNSIGLGHIHCVPANSSLHFMLEENRRQRRLLDWYKRTVVVDADDKKRSVAVVCDTLRTIMDHVRSQDGGYFYSTNLLKAGSYAVKTKIGKADEFDWLVPLNAMALRDTRGYGVMVLKIVGSSGLCLNDRQGVVRVPVCSSSSWCLRLGSLDQCIDTTVYRVPAALVRNGVIVPGLLKTHLHDKIQNAILATGLDKRGVFLSPDMHGPALKLTIVRPGDHNISIDITPSLPTDLPVTTHGWYYSSLTPHWRCNQPFDYLKEEQANEVLRAGTHFVPKEDSAFKLSYSKAETALYKRLDGPNECRKMCHKMVKKFVQTFISQSPIGAPGISSYIFKHQLLHMNKRKMRPGMWNQRHFRERLLDMLHDCVVVLRSGNLRNYFNNLENILAGKDRMVLNRLADHFLMESEKVKNM